MKKRWLPYVIFGLIFYLLFLIIEMPASWFAWGLNRYSSGAVRLDPAAGSLWHGNGRLVLYYPQTVPHDLGNTEWSVSPFWLLTGRVQTHWHSESPDGYLRTTLRLGSSESQLLETEAAFPASAVSAFYSPASLISPQGQVQVRTDKLKLSREGIEGNMNILWRGAASSLSSVQPLGDYHLEIAGAGKTAALKLNTEKGVLDLAGQGQWQIASGKVQLAGSASARERMEELEPLLKLLGADQGNGKRQLTINANMPSLQPVLLGK